MKKKMLFLMKNFNKGIIIQFLIRPQIKFIKRSLKGFSY